MQSSSETNFSTSRITRPFQISVATSASRTYQDQEIAELISSFVATLMSWALYRTGDTQNWCPIFFTTRIVQHSITEQVCAL